MTTTRKITNKLACMLIAIIVSIAIIATATMQVNAASLSVKLTQSGSIYYDNGRAYTIHKYVTFTSGGKSYKRDAYCLQPSLAVPKSKKYSATQIGNSSKMAQCLYFANGAPGESAFRSAMKSLGLRSYIKNDNQYYAFMHIMLAYEYQGTKAFKIYGGGKLSSGYQNAVKKACKWCLSRNITQDASFAVTRNGSNAVNASFDEAKQKFTTQDLTVTGAAGQSFSYTVPKDATLYYKTSSTGGYNAVAAGKSVTLKHGYHFHFEIAPTATAGFTSKVIGNLKSLKSYKVTATASTQNLAFFGVNSGVSATFKVTLTPLQSGTVKISKVYKEYGSSTTNPEENAVFRIYNASFSSYADAQDANTASRSYSATVTTGADGTAISGKLAMGSDKGNVYKVEQVSGKTGYKLAADTTVTLVNNTTVSVGGTSPIVNESFPVNLEITKTSESTGEVINSTGTNAAQYTVYKNEECTQSIGVITCTNGVGRLSNPIAPGTYYVKETRTPTLNGTRYQLDDTVHKIVLNSTVGEAEGTGNDTVYVKKVSYSDKEIAKHNIVIGKTTKGPISENETFDFTVNLKGLVENTTYSYVKLNKDTYEGIKSYFSNLSGYDFKNNAYNFLRNSNYTLANLRSDIITPYASQETIQVQTVTANGSGEATLSLNLKNGDAVIIFETPQSASYKVSEAGPEISGLEIIPSYQIDAPKGAVTLAANEANPGETLATRWEAFPSKVATLPDGSSSSDYPVGILYTNDGTVQHKLIVKKSISGAGMDRNKNYDFALKLKFAGIFNQNPLPDTYTIPGYSIIGEDENGNPVTIETVEKIVSPVTGSDTQTYKFSLKAGEKLVMTGIPNDTYYSLAEKSGDYLRSAKTYQYVSGATDKGRAEEKSLQNRLTLGMFNESNIISGGDAEKINTSTTTSTTTEVDVTNTARSNKDNAINKITLKKEANVTTDEDFNFNVKINLPASFDGNVTPTYYAIGKGTDNWTISVSGGSVTVGNGSSTASIPVTLTRSDGQTVTLYAGNISPDTYIDGESSTLAQWLTTPLIDSESWGSDIVNVPFTAHWLDTDTEMLLTYSNSNPVITIPATKTGGITNVVTVENLNMQAITPGGEGSEIAIKQGQNLRIEGLLPGSSYKITELASTYKPSYVMTRKTVGKKNGESDLGEDIGAPNETLATSEQTLPSSGTYIDTISFMNEKETDDLSVSKETSDQNPTKEFAYTVDLYGSSADGTGTYKAVVPGDKTFDITIDEDGNMQIVQLQGNTIDLSNIPVKIIRPDKKTRTAYTDVSGSISADDYVNWLRETETHNTFDFTVMFLGTEVIMTCNQ